MDDLLLDENRIQDHDDAPSSNGSDIPRRDDTLPDGREVVVIGDGAGWREYVHLQGQNELGVYADCALVACEQILRRSGVEIDETGVVKYATEHGLCVISDDPFTSGGCDVLSEIQVLRDFGVEAHYNVDQSLEGLAKEVEAGKGVIADVNAGVLWNDANSFDTGRANHAILITAVVRDAASGELVGFHINDSGTGRGDQFVTVQTMEKAYLCAGGQDSPFGIAVVTDQPIV